MKLDAKPPALTKCVMAVRLPLLRSSGTELSEHPMNPLRKFLFNFWASTRWMIKIAVISSHAVGPAHASDR